MMAALIALSRSVVVFAWHILACSTIKAVWREASFRFCSSVMAAHSDGCRKRGLFPWRNDRQRERRLDSWYGEIGHQQPAFGGCRWQVPARMFDARGGALTVR